MTNIVDEVNPLDGTSIEDAAKQVVTPVTQEPNVDSNQGADPVNPPVIEPPVINEPPAGDDNKGTVGDLLDNQIKKENLESIASGEQKILEGIGAEISKKKEAPAQPPREPNSQDQDKGDEPSQGFKKHLQEIKQHADAKIAKAQDEQFRAETKFEQNEKQHKVEKSVLEEKIAKLSEEVISLKQESIPKDDDALVAYSYLRNGYKANKDDPQWAQKLGKFHMNFAANYYGIPQGDLDGLIQSYHSRRKSQQDAMSGGYSRSGGGGVSNDIHTQPNANILPNRELL